MVKNHQKPYLSEKPSNCHLMQLKNKYPVPSRIFDLKNPHGFAEQRVLHSASWLVLGGQWWRALVYLWVDVGQYVRLESHNFSKISAFSFKMFWNNLSSNGTLQRSLEFIVAKRRRSFSWFFLPKNRQPSLLPDVWDMPRYKFLSELDDPKTEASGGTDLESSLDGVPGQLRLQLAGHC